jgi:hypothetical protein
VKFSKISYDRILGDKTEAYQKENDEEDINKVIDIIRPIADQEYLDQIARRCFNSYKESADIENDPNASL